jgi:multiple sugar transport system permease protein
MSGITERYVIGSTTTLDIFLYEVFANTDDLGITSAYSVLMAGIVILLMAAWYITRDEKISSQNKYKLMIIITAALQVLFAGKAGIIPAAAYLSGLLSRRIFKISVVVHLIWIIYQVVSAGFLAGFTPGLLPALFIVYYFRKERRPENEKTALLTTVRPRLFNSLNIGFSAFTGIVLLVSSAAILYFLIWMSLSGVSACYIDGPLPPYPGVSSYIKAVAEENIFLNFRNTLLISGLTGAIIPLVSFPAALFLNSRGKAFTAFFLTFLQILGITGGMHSLIPLYSIFSRAGMVNSYLPLIIISLYHSIPFSLFTITIWLENLPASLKDIALVEGQKPLGYLVKIVIPLSVPVMLTSVMTAFTGAWNSFMAPLLFLNDERLYTISIKLYSFAGSIAGGSPQWNVFAAASVINCLIIVLIFIRFRKPVGETQISDFND